MSLIVRILFLVLIPFTAHQSATAAEKPAWDAPSVEGDVPDEWGLTPTDWLVLTDEMLIAKSRLWENLPLIEAGVQKKDVKATTLWVIAIENSLIVSQMAGVRCGSYSIDTSFPIINVDKGCAVTKLGGYPPELPAAMALMELVGNSREKIAPEYWGANPFPFQYQAAAVLLASDFPRAWLPAHKLVGSLGKFTPKRWQGFTKSDGKDSARILLEIHRRGVVPATIKLVSWCDDLEIPEFLTEFCSNRESILEHALDRGSGAAAVPLIEFIVTTEADVTTQRFKRVIELFDRSISMGYWPGEVLDRNGSWHDANGNFKGAAFVEKKSTLKWIDKYKLLTGIRNSVYIDALLRDVDRNIAAFASQDNRRSLRGPTAAKESIPPNISTVSATIIHELEYTLRNDPKYQFTRILETSSAVGNSNKLNERWDYSEGTATLSAGGPENMGSYAHYAFDVSDVKCSRVPTSPTSYDCAFNAALYVNQRLGPFSLINQSFPAAPVKLRLSWSGTRWGSPELRGQFMRNMAASGSAAQTSSGQSQLCRSLNAGVAAAGGKSEHRALNPQTWGC